MADYVLFRKSRNALSSVLHVSLNLILAVGSIFITFITKSPLLGIILVLISKWRTFAVRPRYLFLNLKSNIVDLVVGISFVLIAYCAGENLLAIHFILATLYAVWLTVLKPRSSEFATCLQALASVFLGTTAAVLMSANADSIFMCLAIFIICYGAARHVLVQSDDEDFSIIPVAAGLLGAEFAWLSQSWLIVYSFGSLGIILPQLTIILTAVSYLFGFVYRSLMKNDWKLKWQEIALPSIFTLVLIAILVIGFSQPIFNV